MPCLRRISPCSKAGRQPSRRKRPSASINSAACLPCAKEERRSQTQSRKKKTPREARNISLSEEAPMRALPPRGRKRSPRLRRYLAGLQQDARQRCAGPGTSRPSSFCILCFVSRLVPSVGKSDKLKTLVRGEADLHLAASPRFSSQRVVMSPRPRVAEDLVSCAVLALLYS